jgi:amino acid adenylation domain-containing protein
VISNLQELFFSSAKKFGNGIAIEELSGNSISYAELEKSVREKVSFLSANKIGKGCRVAVMASKSIETISTLLAILETGGTYIPIDPEIPDERVEQILNGLDQHVFIGSEQAARKFGFGTKCIAERPYALPNGNLFATFFNAENHSENLAYILYTSGSTGPPKGVCITHENALAFVNWGLGTFSVNEKDRFSSIAPLHFDLSVFDLYVAFGCGGTVVLFSEEIARNPRKMGEMLSKNKISVCYATPSLLSLILNYGKIESMDFSKLRLTLFAGEIFPVKQLHELMKLWQNTTFYNLYGPTETNVCTYFEIPRPVDENHIDNYPIGKVCPHLEGKITSAGELLIAGKNVTIGYWQRNDLNSKVFVEYEGKKFYKTGDRVEENANGNLIFLGRLDRMIKKRGYRIEPEEVEATLLRHPDVLEAAVIGGKDAEGYTLMKAFLALRKGANASLISIKQHCLELLPVYMIPEQIIFMETLPKTSSGKIDLKSLE